MSGIIERIVELFFAIKSRMKYRRALREQSSLIRDCQAMHRENARLQALADDSVRALGRRGE